MSAETGTIEKTENNWAWVKTRRKSACAGCGQKDHCHSVDGADLMIVKAENLVNARRGDLVEVYLSTAAKMKCLFMIYILPVLGLLIGAFAAESLSNRIGLNPDIGLALFALLGFGIALLAVRAFNNRVARTSSLTPAVRRVIRRAPQSV